MKKYAINLGLTVIGGLGLFFASAILANLFQSPPTRAEFDSFKASVTTNQEFIKEDLNHLKVGQEHIYNLIIEKRK